MSYSFTVTETNQVGNLKMVHGTFTSADLDSQGVLGSSVHGLNYIADYNISLDAGGLGTDRPKVSVSSGEITFTFDNTKGYSGVWKVIGR